MDPLSINTDIDDIISNESDSKKRYTYLIEQCAYKNVTNNDIMKNNTNIYGYGIINILCYHVTQNNKYPFIQFMLEKIPFCNNIIQEKLVLPYVSITYNITDDFTSIITDKLNNLLTSIGCHGSLTEESYKGIINDGHERLYALIDMSHINLFRLSITRNSPIWFSLPTEIVNIGSICNIPIDTNVTELFSDMPNLSSLQHNDNIDNFNKTYPLPDAVYSGSYLKKTEFRSLFSMECEKVYPSCGAYYYYFRLFEDAVKEGGWIRHGGTKIIDLNDTNVTHSQSGVKLVDNEYGRYITGGINRYALFPENYVIHNESSNTLSLTDDDINIKFVDNKCIVIIYNDESTDTILPDILVKEYESAYPISYHMLNKSILGDKYEIDNQDKFMIL